MRFMRYVFVFAILTTFSTWASAGRTDPRLAQIAAAVSIGEKGLAEENPALLTAAAEMLDGVRPSGVDFVSLFADEARFFARGDVEMLQRLDALEFPAPEPDLFVQVLQAGDGLPEDVESAAFVPALPRSICASEQQDDVAICNLGEMGPYHFEERTYVIFLKSDK